MEISSKIQNIKIIAVVAIILILLVIGLIFFPFNIGTEKTIEIKSGSNLSQIANELRSAGLIKDKIIFVFYVTVLGKDDDLKAGRYNFSGRVSAHEITKILTGGFAEHDDIQITVPEGMNSWEIDAVLARAGLIASGEFVKAAINNEGKLFPDTYRFKKNAGVQDMISRMLDNYSAKAPGLKKNDLIIASILEKEAKTKEDMEIVSGIIKNRIEKDMLLQIDAAVTYGACLRDFNRTGRLCDVTLVGVAKEINIDGPYNTYIRRGLPPGPISNPGLKAIEAAQNPHKTDYLYYLSTRDGSRIIYSKTSAEHLANRKRYLGF